MATDKMMPLDEWVARANLVKLADQLNDPALIGLRGQLLRLKANAERALERPRLGNSGRPLL